MQSDGGYKYPGNTVCAVLSVVAIAVVLIVWTVVQMNFAKGLSTLMSVEGTVLWASSLTPKGLLPPPSGFRARCAWFCRQQAGVMFSLNQPMFFAGILLAIIGAIVGSAG
ncbi:MAG: hypothetical protein WBD07_00100 [Vicinamibacterales bacterium]